MGEAAVIALASTAAFWAALAVLRLAVLHDGSRPRILLETLAGFLLLLLIFGGVAYG